MIEMPLGDEVDTGRIIGLSPSLEKKKKYQL
jgi:hypothetical protein